MSGDPLRELGTLIVVVGKARNLPNKSRFGKQDPFCTVIVAEEKQKTKPIKRGGQHPEWDEELRFTIKEDVDDVLAATQNNNSLKSKKDELPPLPTETGVVTPQSLANISRKGVPAGSAPKKKAKKVMRITCYADDPKEPEIIGEALVPIDDVLQAGEVDEWYQLNHKDKYSGEVYLELTFYSNAAPPVKRDVPRPSVSGPVGSSRMPTSVSGMNLYIPPYGQPARQPSPTPQRQATTRQSMTGSQSFAELGVPARQGSVSTVSGQPGLPHSTSYGGVDALAGNMMSMSLNPATRPHDHRHSMIATPPVVGGASALTPPVPSPHRPASVGHNRADTGGTPATPHPVHANSLPATASYAPQPVQPQVPAPLAATPQPAYQQHPAAYPQFQPAQAPYTPPHQQHPGYSSGPSQPPQSAPAVPVSALPPQFQPPAFGAQSHLGTPVTPGTPGTPGSQAPTVPPPPRRLSQPPPIPAAYPQYGSPAGQPPQHPTGAPQGQPPAVPPTPAQQHSIPAPNSGYVPWYLQTGAGGAPPSQPPPLPPAPPKNPNGGYYPSDELYIQQQQQQQQVRPPPSPQPQHQQQHGVPPMPTPPQALYTPQHQPPERSPSPQPPQRQRSVSPMPPQQRRESVSPAPPPPPRPLPDPYSAPPPLSHTLNYAAQQTTDFSPSAAHSAPEGWKSTIQPSKIGTVHVNHTHGPPAPTLPGGAPARQSTMTSNRDWRNYLGSLGGSAPQTPPQPLQSYGGSPQHMQQQNVFGVGPPPPPPALFGTPPANSGFTAPYGAPGSAYGTPTQDGQSYGTPQQYTPTHQGSYGTPSELGRQDTTVSHSQSGHSHSGHSAQGHSTLGHSAQGHVQGHGQHDSGGGSAVNADPFSVLHAQYSAAAQPNWYTPPPSVPTSLYQQQQQWR